MKKGFTLIELLAVIVILAIIALISTPIILNVIETAKKGAAESSALGYVDAIEKAVIINQVKKENLISPGEYTKSDLDSKNVEIKGEITDARVVINSKGQVEIGRFCINNYSINYNSKKAEYDKDSNYCDGISEIGSKLSNTKITFIDSNSNNNIDILDEVIIGTESFYVISNDGNVVKMLAKYNLLVGQKYDSRLDSYEEILNPTYKQDSTVTGSVEGETSPSGFVDFSNSSKKGINFSSYEGSLIEEYVNEYVSKLNNSYSGLNLTGTLITEEELETIGCSSSTKKCTSEKEELFNKSFWTKTSVDDEYILGVKGTYFSEMSPAKIMQQKYNGNEEYGIITKYFGVRPVIIISSSLIK